MHTPHWFQRLLARRHGGVIIVLCLSVGAGFLTRLALLIKAAGDVSWGPSLVGSFLIGAVYDLGSAFWCVLPLVVVLAALPKHLFASRWTRGIVHLGLLIVTYLLLFGAVSEWFFWDEFGVRFNFIAVDYLVYTTEVIGNIRESYPMPRILGGIFVASLVLYALFARIGWIAEWLNHAAEPLRSRWRTAAAWMLVCLGVGLGLGENLLPGFANNYNRELAKSGLWSLFAAFRANQLDYDRFYPTMPVEDAFKRMHDILGRDGSRYLSENPHDLLRWVKNPGPEQRVNVIQITVESLSADFLSIFNRASNLTPNLAGIASQSLVFENFYATGTRTDRGMEALTLSVPPTPGRSLVKRPKNENMFTLGSVFRAKGYDTAFIYGGFGYFDNMNYFFGNNGYRVIDRTGVDKKDITFANVWGACDEDLFRWTLREADASAATGKPFHYFVMTTSNHRPYTFPEGRIDLPSKVSGRAGAVKYTDYAIGKFLKDAETKPWFKNTIFVIVADHCASSAGKSELPVQNYHIPLFVYAPGGQVKPGRVQTLTSQVDFAPTLLGLLGWSYPSRFYGHNVLTQTAAQPGRALIGNYQKLGLYQSGQLGVLKPVRQSLTLRYDPASYEMKVQDSNASLIDEAIATYQTACWLFKNGGQRELSAAEFERYTKSNR
jgi:phosphoglycerol transferase MdoB-like AlkP superfamily enzyme